MHYHYIAVFWLFIFPVIGLGQEFQPPVPKVDERIELLTIVFRLAGAEEFFSQSFPLYTDEIDRHFSSFQDHKAVKYVRDVLRRSGIGQDAVVNFGIHLSLEREKVTFPDETNEELKHLDSRWHPKVARRFVSLLDDFYTTTDFHHFFQQHRETYQLMEDRFAKISDTVDYSWFENFYGTKHLGRFDIILMPGFDDGGFAAKCADKDGIDQFYAFIGTEMINHEGKPFYNAEIHARLIVHEFNHSWCNPIVDKYFLQFEDDIASAFSSVSQKMNRLSYGTPRIMMYEYCVRLADIAYLKKHFQRPAVARQYQQRCKMLGFILMDELVPLLDQYENNRDLHPRFDDFAPEIMQNMNHVEQSRPKAVAMDPPNHAKDVDASITQIRVTFDRPMSSAMAWCSADGNATFPKIVTPAPSWSEDRKTCTMAEISLEPNTTYNIWLNLGVHDSFQSVDGMVLSDTFYTFTTAPDQKNEANE